MKNQLKQVIYTACEFPTVQAVQFLIDGKVVPYMSESVYTEKPLHFRCSSVVDRQVRSPGLFTRGLAPGILYLLQFYHFSLYFLVMTAKNSCTCRV